MDQQAAKKQADEYNATRKAGDPSRAHPRMSFENDIVSWWVEYTDEPLPDHP